MSFTKKDIEHLQASLKIRGYVITPMKRNVPEVWIRNKGNIKAMG